ncbi:MAG: penicillin-binding protein 2 [Pseudomonadota bacterium]
MRLIQEYTADIEHRFKYALIAVLLLFVVIVGRLYYLQIIKGRFYHFFSTENSIKAISVPAARGMIFDRRGQVLVDNRPLFNITITPQYVVDPKRMVDTLYSLLLVPKSEIEEVWEKRKKQPSYQPLIIKEDASRNEIALIRAHKNPLTDPNDPYDLRGIDVEVNYQRNYSEGNIATHVLGYVREIDPEMLTRYKKEFPGIYHRGDYVGIRGLEEKWDLVLRGKDGYEEHVVDAVGRQVDYEGIASELSHEPSVVGESLKLTIDRDLQEVAKELFGERKGAAVAIDPNDGAILAMYSSPSYDLNWLVGPGGSQYWNQISSSPEKYLLNRAIQGGYPPGSTYKILTAIAALSEGVVKPDENIVCRGSYVFGGRPYHCWAKGGHGPISIHRAIVASCDVFFYNMGLRLGVDRLAKYANILSLGRKTGVPLSGEKEGLIPTSEWKEKRFGVPWQAGENLSIAVGQGYDVVTPIQNALLAAQVANGGKKLELHLVDTAFDVEGNESYKWQSKNKPEMLPIDPEVFKIVKAGMDNVTKPGGTAGRLSAFKVSMGGKTGTAQVVALDGGAVCRTEICRDHAWFIGYAPAENPEIAAAVVVEHGGFGASAAAPIVGEMLQRYYDIVHGSVAENEKEVAAKIKRGIEERIKTFKVKAEPNAIAEAEPEVKDEVEETKRDASFEEKMLDLEILQPEAGPPQAENPKH